MPGIEAPDVHERFLKVYKHLMAGKFIDAIKAYRQITNVSLQRAREEVQEMEKTIRAKDKQL